ncbi:tereporin-Ca1-like isoform X2 [Littorina saxatilis]|uniref:tereporin-Ca1-like isoform X2 n=1 Tax=Littorina saxatilis TaxID=31220 RepID=UPI0038B54528
MQMSTMSRRGNEEQAQRTPDTRPEVAIAADSAISRGTTLVGTSTHALMQDGYRVTAGIEVENWTKFPLSDASATMKGGVLSVAPYSIMPASRQALVGRKTWGTATGSYGTVSWRIAHSNQRLVVMWSAPFNFNHYSNWLGVGIAKAGSHPNGDSWFDQMYYYESNGVLNFRRKDFYNDVRSVKHRDTTFEVEGIMCSDHKALAKVIFKPVREEDLAPSIREKLES